MTKTWAVAVASFNTKTLVPQICFPNECWSTNSFFDGWAQGQWRFRWWRPRLAILDKRWHQEIARREKKTLKNLLYPLWSHCRAKLGFAKFIHWIVHKYVIYEDCMFSHLILSQVSGRLHYYKTNPQRQRTKHRSDMLGIAPTNITNVLFTFIRLAPFRFNGCRVNTKESQIATCPGDDMIPNNLPQWGLRNRTVFRTNCHSAMGFPKARVKNSLHLNITGKANWPNLVDDIPFTGRKCDWCSICLIPKRYPLSCCAVWVVLIDSCGSKELWPMSPEFTNLQAVDTLKLMGVIHVSHLTFSHHPHPYFVCLQPWKYLKK